VSTWAADPGLVPGRVRSWFFGPDSLSILWSKRPASLPARCERSERRLLFGGEGVRWGGLVLRRVQGRERSGGAVELWWR